jgi:hypothetical protein
MHANNGRGNDTCTTSVLEVHNFKVYLENPRGMHACDPFFVGLIKNI